MDHVCLQYFVAQLSTHVHIFQLLEHHSMQCRELMRVEILMKISIHV